MYKEKKSKDTSLEAMINGLQAADFNKTLEVIKQKIKSQDMAQLNSCVRCGLCANSCQYYLTNRDTKSIPAHKLDLVAKVLKRHFTWVGKKFPWWNGAGDIDHKLVREWVDSLFGRCSLCGRCSLNCTMGINISNLIRKARGSLAASGLVPYGLQSTVETALESGNNMGISKDDWQETVEWLEEELQQETKDTGARLPLDVKGANILYMINPREAMFFPLSISAVGKIFYAAGENWTFSSEHFDVTNYGLYTGDDEAARTMSERIVSSMEKLECRTLVLAECGHGFNANRWEAPEWLNRKHDFEVKSILEVVADYIREGRIRLDASRNSEVTTIHDPCNLVRLGGIVEEQRFILRHSVSFFEEMMPNKEKNFCCGGGGGQLSMTRFVDRRLNVGEVKADQIRKTGATVVAAPCHNCIDQLTEISKHYKLDVKIKTVCEIVADALVIDKKIKSTSGSSEADNSGE